MDVEDLPDITAQEEEFIRVLLFDAEVKGCATTAYRKVYGDDSHPNMPALSAAAGRLKMSKRIQAWLAALRKAGMDRLVCSLEEHLSVMGALREEAREKGQYAAAINAEYRRGQAAGLYVERKEILHKKGDDLGKLIELARNGSRDIAEKYAKDLGLHEELMKELNGATMH